MWRWMFSSNFGRFWSLFLWIFFLPFFLFSFQDCKEVNGRYFIIVSHVSEGSVHIFPLFPCSSVLIISINLSLGSLSLNYVSSELIRPLVDFSFPLLYFSIPEFLLNNNFYLFADTIYWDIILMLSMISLDMVSLNIFITPDLNLC